jgi:hypothetical protein
MDKKDQAQLNKATEDIKRLEKILSVVFKRTEILAKENVKLRATAHKLQGAVMNLEVKLRNRQEG